MAKQFDRIEDAHRAFIEAQHIFFCGTAAANGRVNISPKGTDSLRVMSPNRIVWRNLTGSGNETAGHLLDVNRMTIMWCGFETRPMIMRAYGTARALHPRDAGFAELDALFAPAIDSRQIFDMQVDLLQTSCGYGVPFYDYKSEREAIVTWAEDKGPDGIAKYWHDENQTTLDGLPTRILDDA